MILSTPEEVAFVQTQIKKKPRCRFVEIGVWKGGMTLALAPLCEKYFAVDHFKGSPDLRCPDPEAIRQEFVKNTSHLMNVDLVHMDSRTAASIFFDGEFDIVYIDGDHTEAGCAADIEAWWPKLRCGGFMMGHDYDKEHPGVIKAVDKRFGQPQETSNSRWSVWKVTK